MSLHIPLLIKTAIIKLQGTLKATLQAIKNAPEKTAMMLSVLWILVIMGALLALTGCASYETQLPANLATRCPDAPVFEGQTLGDLMGYTVDILEQYHECKARMDSVATWADRA
jgi:hypothetical protein